MGVLDDLGGFLDNARTQLGRVDQIVKQGEQLHRQVAGGAAGKLVGLPPADVQQSMADTSRWLAPVAIVVGVVVIAALAKGVRS